MAPLRSGGMRSACAGIIMDARPPHHPKNKSTAPSNWSGETGDRGKETRSVPNDVTDDLRAWAGSGPCHGSDRYRLISHDAAPQLSSGTATPQHRGLVASLPPAHTHYEDGVTRWSTLQGPCAVAGRTEPSKEASLVSIPTLMPPTAGSPLPLSEWRRAYND